jgi:hypothetical protein
MIQRRDRASLALESLGMLSLETLDRDDAIDSCVAGLPYLAHPARAEGNDQLVGAGRSAGSPSDHDDAILADTHRY